VQVDPDDLVFIDESGFNIAMATAYGRGPRGQRVHDEKPVNRGKNYTVVGAITNDRVVCHRTLEGAMNKARFIDFVCTTLCPRLPPGSVVVLDNLRPHHAPEVREALEARGCRVLYLPPYSPEFNPIELCWSFIKNRLRRLGKRAVDELKCAIRNAFLRVRTTHLVAWFAHCGYCPCK
jgi:transposase